MKTNKILKMKHPLKRGRNLFWIFSLVLFCSSSAQAVSFKAGNVRLNINAYLDFEGTWMSKMPMGMMCSAAVPCTMPSGMTLTGGAMVMNMNPVFWFDQNHMNLFIGAEIDKLKVFINLESRHAYSTFNLNTGSSGNVGMMGQGGTVGAFRIAEAYGNYRFYDALEFRAGFFLTPFGIYNDIRYVTPLFASVMLPFLYELPPNYNAPPIVPSGSNLMIHGQANFSNAFSLYYAAYVGAGLRNLNMNAMADAGFGREANNDKLFGGRLLGTFWDNYKLGISAYTVDEKTTKRIFAYAADLDLLFPIDVRLQGEFAFFSQGPNNSKWTYYSRLMYEGFESYTPFFMFDVFKDNAHVLYKFTQMRFGIGQEYSLTANWTLKGEYHLHFWKSRPTATGTTAMGMPVTTVGKKVTNMVRISSIFYF